MGKVSSNSVEARRIETEKQERQTNEKDIYDSRKSRREKRRTIRRALQERELDRGN